MPTFTLTFTRQDIEMLGRALGQLPYAAVAPLIAKLDAQLAEQQKPEEEPK